MNIFLHELRSYGKSTVFWMVGLIFMTLFFLSVFPSFHDQIDEMTKIMVGLPEVVRKGFDLNIATIFTLSGYYAYIMPYVLLCGAVQATGLGLSLLSKETTQKTADFLLTKPVSRARVITAKLSAGLLLILLTNLVYLPAAYLIATTVSSSYDHQAYLMLALSLLLTQLFFLVFGFLIAAFVPKIKSPPAMSLVISFIFFILNLFGSVIGSVAIRYLTPFKFYDVQYVTAHAAYEPKFMLYEAVLVVIAVAVTYAVYTKRDVAAV